MLIKSIAFSLPALISFQALAAADKVSAPDVTKGNLEFEYRASNDFDSRASKDNSKQFKSDVNYGVTNRFRIEFKSVINELPHQSSKLSSIETSLRYQFFKKDEAFLSSAIETTYKASTQAHQANAYETKLLFSKDINKVTNIANIAFYQQVGADRKSGTDIVVSWKSRYNIISYFEPGFEVYRDFGRINLNLPYQKQTVQYGPTISGKIGKHYKYDVGYLYGKTTASPNGRVKAILTYVVKF